MQDTKWRPSTNRYQKLLDQMEPYTPEEPYNVISDELEKLGGLESSSAEFNVTRNYLDWLTSLPWEKQSKERLDLVHAKSVGHSCTIVIAAISEL